MISKEYRQALERMKDSAYATALKAVLDDKREQLKDFGTLTSWDETLGRKHALKLIDEIFSFLGEKVDVKEKTGSQYE